MAEAQGLDQAGDDKMSEAEWVGACEDCGAPLVAGEEYIWCFNCDYKEQRINAD